MTSLKSQRNRIGIRSRSGSPASRKGTPDLSSVIDPKCLSRVLVSPPLGLGNMMDISTNSMRVSPTLSSPDSGLGSTIGSLRGSQSGVRERKSSISEETVSIKPKESIFRNVKILFRARSKFEIRINTCYSSSSLFRN